jgi:GNAT superfamily N-acetyltransferase
MTFDIVVPETPLEEHRSAIVTPLVAFNEAAGGHSEYRQIAVLLQDKTDGRTVGGLWGKIAYTWLFVELLFVPEAMRGAGAGSHLLARAEEIARAHSCVGVWLDTYSFQAPGFYLKQGYEVFGTLDGGPTGPGRSFFRKAL